MSLAITRLKTERSAWRQDHPHGFFARLDQRGNRSTDIMKWKCGIPGKNDTIWAGGTFPLELNFTEDYPHTPPKCKFPAGFFHPNVYPSGTVCLSILNEEEAWRPGVTIKQILLGVQDLLDTPNPLSPAQEEAYRVYQKDQTDYKVRVKAQVEQYATDMHIGGS